MTAIVDWKSKDKEQLVEWLHEVMQTNIVKVTFEKKDGTLREMNCTLKDVPAYERKTEAPETPRKKNEGVLSVFDADIKEWRSFRIDSIRSIVLEL